MKNPEHRKSEAQQHLAPRTRRPLLGSIAALLLCAAAPAFAGSAQWNNSATSDYNTSSNWTPATVPNSSSDVATFGVSSQTALSLSSSVTVDRFVFSAGASTYTIAVPASKTLTFSGVGITNNSGKVQTLQTFGGASAGTIIFSNGASAGTQTAFTNNGASASGNLPGGTQFLSTSTANSATLTNAGSTISGGAGGYTLFSGTSTASSATLVANGGTNGGQGGAIVFNSGSTGGTSTVKLTGNGFLDISTHTAGSVTIGSLETAGVTTGTTATAGTGGNVFLGKNNLIVGGNNASTTFADVIQDGASPGVAAIVTASSTSSTTSTGSTGRTGSTGSALATALSGGSTGSTTTAGATTTGGSLTKIGTGTLTLSGINTYTGGTTINGGVLAISNDNNLGDAKGSLNFNNSTTLSSSATLTTGATSGTGTASSTTATANNAATLKTLASITSARSGVLGTGGGTIDTNGFDSTFSGVFSGAGGLTKAGDGALTLSGKNTYTGDTIVNAGSLSVNGSIASAKTTINTGALLVGMGMIGGNVTNNGFVATGDLPLSGGGLQSFLASSGLNSVNLNISSLPASQLTLTVKGNYTQGSSGTLVIAYGGSLATQHTTLAVQGQANLDGTLRLIQVNGATLKTNDSVPIVTATGGVTGKFANVVGNTLLGQGVNVSYATPNEVLLQVTGGTTLTTLQQTGSLPPNVAAAAKALDSAAGDPRAAGIFAAIANQTPAELLDSVQRISGQQLTSQNAIGNSVSGVHVQNLAHHGESIRSGATGFSSLGFQTSGTSYDSAAGYAGPAGPADKESKEIAPPPNPKWGGFISGAGQWNRVGDTEQARGFSLDSGGITLGIDYKFTPNFVAGVFLGYTHTSIDIGQGGGIGVDVGKLGIYSTFFTGGFYLDSAVQGGYDGYSSRRAGLGGFARSDTHGGDLNVVVSPGYDFKVGALTIGPVASFQYGYQATNRFTEHDSLAPLSVDPTHTNSFISTIGMKATYDWKVGSHIIRPELRLSYQHEYGDVSTDVTSRLASGAGDAFTVTGPEIGRDSMLLGAGFAVVWSDRVTSYVYYDGEFFRTNYDSSAVSGGFRITF